MLTLFNEKGDSDFDHQKKRYKIVSNCIVSKYLSKRWKGHFQKSIFKIFLGGDASGPP